MNGRRDFLRGLATLPLIGGGLTLIGKPTSVAEPVTLRLLDAYKTWLHFERRAVAWEMAMLPDVVASYGGNRSSRFDGLDHHATMTDIGDVPRFHQYDGSAPAGARAALVLSTVGANWRREAD